ncbi:Sensor protein ZraS [Mucisphaera calidilacus]|uniref:histidine kinase n=2 Tax=Mucisphaera calidilacus TaxID=2527982 RepID=A0A518BVZ2_9BACT|nr:Sensor protein ZraS [Mucisphaera calidilacus]
MIGALAGSAGLTLWLRQRGRRRRQRERQAVRDERLAELTMLTGGLAHEIKNPLSTLGLNIQLIDEDLTEIDQAIDTSSPADQPLRRVRRRFAGLGRETRRLREILEDFLRFAGRVKLEKDAVDVNTLVEELTDFFQPQADEARVHLRMNLADNAGRVQADAGLLKQAVMNLMINAVQAMTAARDRDEPHGGADELLLHTERTSSGLEDEVRIRIVDTGPGIPEDVLGRIFQPYFSTKRQGTGLGLPTSRRLIEEHGGQLLAHSEIGRGTEFVIALPAGNEKPAPPLVDEAGV